MCFGFCIGLACSPEFYKVEHIEKNKEVRLKGDVWGHKDHPETWILLTEVHPEKDDYHTGYEFKNFESQCGYIQEYEFGFRGLYLIYRKKD